MGHFALTGWLLDLIVKTPGSRVVNVSSLAHKQGHMDFDNLLYEGAKGYSRIGAYSRSKLANLLFTYELQRFFEGNSLESIAIAAHPGLSNTNLFRHLEKYWMIRQLSPLFTRFTQGADAGALPEIRAAVDPEVKGGEYYGPDGFREMKGFPVLVQSNKASHSREDARKLWEVSEKLTGVRFRV
ncbi:MAG: hypothetical protein U5K79_14210 [Cyclobacteriaceae bacterium]|nr:hypothetical protein [Cyclobacteriaceae bacterium]